MSLTFEQARDEILEIFRGAWPEDINNVVWDDVVSEAPATALSWARVALRHTLGEQGSLADDTGKKRWDRFGILFIQIFTPVGEGLDSAYPLAKILADAYEGVSTPGNAWFRNATIKEIGNDGEWYQFNYSVEFQYEEVK
jgi:hypothetical protein